MPAPSDRAAPRRGAAGAAPRRSRRLPWAAPVNALTRAAGARRAAGLPLLDLITSDPTAVGLAYPEEELGEILRRAAGPAQAQHPRGLPAAREALAAALSRPGDAVSPDDLLLTASTSEAYSFLFKRFADPGDAVLTAAPAYPLLASLAGLDGLTLRHFALEPGRRGFALDPGAAARALTARTRLLVVVHPGNPLGAYLSAAEHQGLDELCAARALPLVADEVFADYALALPASASAGAGAAAEPGRAGAPAAAEPGGAAAASPDAALPPDLSLAATARGGAASTLALGGLSKSAGLPSWKLAWIRLGGASASGASGGAAAAERRRLAADLELIADTYLPVSAPIQRALPGVLALAPRIRAAIGERLRGNLARLGAAFAGLPAIDLLPPAAGWSAVLRVPRVMGDEELALDLLDRAGVLVHPGYFFDFAAEGYLVVSLLPHPDVFAAALACLARRLGELIAP